MTFRTRLLLAAIALTSVAFTAWAGPPPQKVDPGSARRLPATPLSEEARRALSPAADRTGPCTAELSVDRVDVARSADGTAYNVTVTISNIGTEPAVGAQTNAGGVLGVALEVKDVRRMRSYFAQVADITIIHPLTSRTFTGAIPVREVHSQSTQITALIDRGPDGPRCAYDARRNNDGMGISAATMRDWFAAGNAVYTVRAPWAR